MNKALPRFISFDGADGVGKTTQLNIFADMLRSRGKNVKVTKALGGDGQDFVQNELRKLLLSAEFPADDYENEEKLFAISDSRNLDQSSRFLSTNSNSVVICDRGMCSHIVYSLAKNISVQELNSWHRDLYIRYQAMSETYGGLNVVLVPADAQMAMDRVLARGVQVTPRLENLDMQAKVIKGMRAIVEDDSSDEYSFIPHSVTEQVLVTVNRNEDIAAVTQKILAALRAKGYAI